MKRERSEYEESIKNLDIVKCLMILSRTSIVKQIGVNQFTERNTSNRFECKTCNRRFSSFQALGGHRASHKKPKLTVDEKDVKHLTKNYKGTHMHKCSRCGQSFGTGQALGGHMRRHRSSMTLEPSQRISPVIPTMPVMKRCSSSKRQKEGDSHKFTIFIDVTGIPLAEETANNKLEKTDKGGER
ncbi:hypothetical protein Bca101_002055 [Brassica carinata]